MLADFPGYFAGASLKPPSSRTHKCVPMGLPRLLRRGLIEAPFSRVVTARILRTDFPGYFAGASLKRRR